jgi:uncharacterized membrane protein
MTGGVERVLRWVYSAALAIAAPLLLAGLLLGRPGLLEAGVLTVMITPVIGVVILSAAMALDRDWPFTAVALLVLAILAAGVFAGARARL